MTLATLAAALLLGQTQVWNPGTGYFNYDGGTNYPGPLYPYMTPSGPIGPGSSYPYTSNADVRTKSQGPIYAVNQIGDFDSILPSNVANRYWNQQNGPTNCQSAAELFVNNSNSLQSPSPFSTAVAINSEASAGAFNFYAPFTAPAGTTSVTLTVPMVKGFSASAGNVGIGFLDNGCAGTLHVDNYITPTTAWTNYTTTLTVPTLVTNQPVDAHVSINTLGTTGVGDALIGPVTLKPFAADGGIIGDAGLPVGVYGPNGVFTADWWRIGAQANTLWYNFMDSTTQSTSTGTNKWAPDHEMVIDTDATQMAVEFQNTSGTIGYALAIYVDGQLTNYYLSQTNYADWPQFTLPTGMKRVEIEAGDETTTGVTQDNWVGSMLRAVYVPASATTWVESEPIRLRRLLVFEDSLGHYATLPNLQAPYVLAQDLEQILRQNFNGTVYSEVLGGNAMWIATGNNTSVGIQTKVDEWARVNPTDIWIASGYNDWVNTYWSSATVYGQAIGKLMDQIKVRIPLARLWAQSTLITNAEGATNGNAETISAYRTAMQNACAARPWCNFTNGSTIIAVADLQDGHHPFSAGENRFAWAILNALQSPPTVNGYATFNGTCTMVAGTTCTVTDATVQATSNIQCAPNGATVATLASFTGAVITANASYQVNASVANSDTWNCTQIH